MVDVYISPENRDYPHGPYNGQNTYEKEQCELIADELEKSFGRCGITYLRAAADAGMEARCKEANAKGHRVYLSVHTNAAGGVNTTVRGTSVFYFGPEGTPSYRASELVLAELVALGLKNRGLTDKSDWYEPRNSNGATVYCEVEFHDHKDGAAWIVSHRPQIAEAITKGLCAYLGKEYRQPQNPPTGQGGGAAQPEEPPADQGGGAKPEEPPADQGGAAQAYAVRDAAGKTVEEYPASAGEDAAVLRFSSEYGSLEGYTLVAPDGTVIMKSKKNPDGKSISWDDLRGVLKEQMGIENIVL